jgi:putative Mn2+ efflux pump MntP
LSILESTLIVIGLSMNIFLIGQYEGSMIRKIEWRAVFVVCLIVGVFETFAMLGGYLLTRIPFFSLSESADLKHFCCFVAAILFLLIASYMLYKAFRHAPVQERLNKIAYKRILLEVVLVAVFTFMAGIGWGFIGHNIILATSVIAGSTVLAAIVGIWAGYREGCRGRYGFYMTGGAMLAFVGAEILVRYL